MVGHDLMNSKRTASEASCSGNGSSGGRFARAREMHITPALFILTHITVRSSLARPCPCQQADFVSGLTDDQLRAGFRALKVAIGPINGSSRKYLEKKYRRMLEASTDPAIVSPSPSPVASPAVRRRGRPPKKAAVDAVPAPALFSDDDSAPSPPTRRSGRPPKKAVAVEASAAALFSDDDSAARPVAASSTKKPKTKSRPKSKSPVRQSKTAAVPRQADAGVPMDDKELRAKLRRAGLYPVPPINEANRAFMVKKLYQLGKQKRAPAQKSKPERSPTPTTPHVPAQISAPATAPAPSGHEGSDDPAASGLVCRLLLGAIAMVVIAMVVNESIVAPGEVGPGIFIFGEYITIVDSLYF